MRSHGKAMVLPLDIAILRYGHNWGTLAVGGWEACILLCRGRVRTPQIWASCTGITLVLRSPVSLNFSEIFCRWSIGFRGPFGRMLGSFWIRRVPQLLLLFSAFQRLRGNSFPTPLLCRGKLLILNVPHILCVCDFFHFLAADLKESERNLLACWAIGIDPMQLYVGGRRINSKQESTYSMASWWVYKEPNTRNVHVGQMWAHNLDLLKLMGSKGQKWQD